ncbi:MAG: hypothetical protein EOO79_03680, partial [Oxalobacteraceae bacterium]
YIRDSVAGVARWNRVLEKAGLAFRLVTPHKAFNRHIGTSRSTSWPLAMSRILYWPPLSRWSSSRLVSS